MSIAKIRSLSAVIPRDVTADTLVLLLHNLPLIDDRRSTEGNRFAADDGAGSKETAGFFYPLKLSLKKVDRAWLHLKRASL
jgi:hypothetical protein